jgi:uncharacterized protein (TIGR02145 family)
MTDEICPSGWHIPSDEEFTELTDFLGGEDVAGEAMKSTSGWANNGNGTNSSGFTGLPGGERNLDGENGGIFFMGIGSAATYWSASESSSYRSWIRTFYYNQEYVHRYSFQRYRGFSARCVRD